MAIEAFFRGCVWDDCIGETGAETAARLTRFMRAPPPATRWTAGGGGEAPARLDQRAHELVGYDARGPGLLSPRLSAHRPALAGRQDGRVVTLGRGAAQSDAICLRYDPGTHPPAGPRRVGGAAPPAAGALATDPGGARVAQSGGDVSAFCRAFDPAAMPRGPQFVLFALAIDTDCDYTAERDALRACWLEPTFT